MDQLLKDSLLNFRDNWTSYLENCEKLNAKGKKTYSNNRNHEAHKIFISELPSFFKNILDEKKYFIKSSLGEGNVAGIPWLCIMHRDVTNSVTRGFYIAYLFSRNAKKVYLSIGLGATQFSELHGENLNKCIPKIEEARSKFLKLFQNYGPDNNDKMDLFDESDQEFIIKEFSASPRFKTAAYEAGSCFTKSYQLDKKSLNDVNLENDLNEYIKSYEKILDDPNSIAFVENLAESGFDVDKLEQSDHFNYEIPSFDPPKMERIEKGYNPKINKFNKASYHPQKPSKKVGDAGEKHVYKREYNYLKDIGRQDLAEKIVKQYEDKSSYPGYDIQSFDEKGNKIFIEVKSTKSKKKDYFEISDNEINAAKYYKDQFYIYQVINALVDPKIDVRIKNPISYIDQDRIFLDPWIYKMKIK